MVKSVKVIVGLSMVFTGMVVLVAFWSISDIKIFRSEQYLEGDKLSSSDQKLLVGSWVEPNPIDSSVIQGFTLNADGSASSINMGTLRYSKWWIEPGKLVLVSRSIGNGVSIIDTTVCPILLIGEKTLDLKYGNLKRSYRKRD